MIFSAHDYCQFPLTAFIILMLESDRNFFKAFLSISQQQVLEKKRY